MRRSVAAPPVLIQHAVLELVLRELGWRTVDLPARIEECGLELLAQVVQTTW